MTIRYTKKGKPRQLYVALHLLECALLVPGEEVGYLPVYIHKKDAQKKHGNNVILAKIISSPKEETCQK